MRWLQRALLAAVLPALSCQPKTTGEDAEQTEVSGTSFELIPTSGDALVFPPPPTRRERRPLAREVAEVEPDKPAEIQYPKLDDKRHFEFAGQTVRIEFNRRVEKKKRAKGALTIEPAVKGKVTFRSPWTLVFVAAKPFDPDKTYKVSLGEVKDDKGNLVEEGWTATFRADPQIWIAGKVISYIPDEGKPRVLSMLPWDGAKVGPDPNLQVLFDQPVDVDKVGDLVKLYKNDGTTELAAKFGRPSKDFFQGEKVDRKHVVTVRPEKAVATGDEFILSARDFEAKPEDAETMNLEVAERLRFTDVDCGYDKSRCQWADGTLKMRGRDFTLVFNNPIQDKGRTLKQSISISPPVDNFSVWSDHWSDTGRVYVSGAFKPSTSYKIHVARVKDRYDSSLLRPVDFTLETAALPASVSMTEGIRFLDEKRSRRFVVSTRNVKKATLKLWKVEDNARAWSEAQRAVGSRQEGTGSPTEEIKIAPKAVLDESVDTKINLLKKLDPGTTWIASLSLDEVDFDAPKPKYPEYSMSRRPPHALVTVNDANAIALHARTTPDTVIVQASRLSDGAPIAGAHLFLDGQRVASLKTDARGFAAIPATAQDARAKLLRVEKDGRQASLPLGHNVRAAHTITPDLTGGSDKGADLRTLVISDRGVYRPGATMHFKAILRHPEGGDLLPVVHMPVQLRVLDPTGNEVMAKVGVTDDMGNFVGDYEVDASASIGRYRTVIEPMLEQRELGSTSTQVAEFEPPRFKVDVTAKSSSPDVVRATVEGRYLFGAAMENADVDWTLRRSSAPMPKGSLTGAGLRFRHGGSSSWSRSGSGRLDDAGQLLVRQKIEVPDDEGPQRFTLEAEVSDSSHRAIAGRGSVVVHPAERYAGIKVHDRWPGIGAPIGIQLGVMDREGKAVTGAEIKLELVRRDYKRTRKPGPGGSVRVEWIETKKTVDTCKVESGSSPVSCDVTPRKSGSYLLHASVDGRRGGMARVWAYGEGDVIVDPTPGHRIELIADKRSYAAGETAKVVVRNPFESATAVFTIERSGVLHKESRTIPAGIQEFAVPVEASYAPNVHATVTLLPVGGEGEQRADWKFGAISIPVEMGGVSVDVKVASDRPHYEPGQEAEITIEVNRAGTPVAGADVTLAVVDEGVLRLTNFRAPDPVKAMRPAVGLRFEIADTRRAFAEMLGRSHVAGDGPGAGAQSLVATRKNFVRTALWKPNLRTGKDGTVKVKTTLPDNLTEFRMMAVVLDKKGRGGVTESSFEVKKPLMIIPAVPRFALVGDRFEAAVMVHSGLDSATTATVTLGEQTKDVELAAGGGKRVAFEINPTQPGPMALVFSVKDGEGRERDRVESKIPVRAPGVDERPRLAGAFVGAQEIILEVPAGVSTDLPSNQVVQIIMGAHAWPELGARLDFLVDYPHGCVEQTTSSTLPLLAARDILPRLGYFRWSREKIDEMVKAGIERLASMQVSGGGLAYWPGGYAADVYGTAYAMRAVALADKEGIASPPGLLDGMKTYLEEQLRDGTGYGRSGAEVRAAVALALAEADGLPESSADLLFDTVKEQGVFGKATLALSLSTLEGQDERVSELLGELEAAFEENGDLKAKREHNDFYYYGSSLRTQAQATLALTRLRPQSAVLPGLEEQLVRRTGSYTTQGTAFGLIALRERIVAVDNADGEITALLDGQTIMPDVVNSVKMGSGGRRYEIPFEQVAGRRAVLHLQSTADTAVRFMVEAKWKRPLDAEHSPAETSSKNGPEVYRVYTDPSGKPIEMSKVQPGQMIRVALLARLPVDAVERERLGYLAMTDRIPAGFEPIQPDLWTVSRPPEMTEDHPLYEQLRWSSAEASNVELRDDRVHLYFDRVWGEYAAGNYLMRATTPGTFTVPPAMAELMYEPDSTGYGASLTTTVLQR